MLKWMTNKTRGSKSVVEAFPAVDGVLITGHAGFLSGMHVATSHGWRAVENLRIGEQLLTFDHGFRPVLDIQRETIAFAEGEFPQAHQPVFVPKEAMGNGAGIWLMPEQGLLIESDTVLDVLSDPFAVVPAQALSGFQGIERKDPTKSLTVNTLAFEHDEVVYIEGGLLAYCPKPRTILMDDMVDQPLYDVLNPRAARYLVACLIEDHDTKALICDREEIADVAVRSQENQRPPISN